MPRSHALFAAPMALAIGCSDAAIPETWELDGGLDAARPGHDAGEIDGRSTGMIDATTDLDTGFLGDAIVDPDAADAAPVHCLQPAPIACVAPQPPSVACGSLTCTGSQPYCCEYPAEGGRAHECVGSSDACRPDGGIVVASETDVLLCDDSSDCAADELCTTGYSRPFARYRGASCVPRCRTVPFPEGVIAQRCADSCECPAGEACRDGLCRPAMP